MAPFYVYIYYMNMELLGLWVAGVTSTWQKKKVFQCARLFVKMSAGSQGGRVCERVGGGEWVSKKRERREGQRQRGCWQQQDAWTVSQRPVCGWSRPPTALWVFCAGSLWPCERSELNKDWDHCPDVAEPSLPVTDQVLRPHIWTARSLS